MIQKTGLIILDGWGIGKRTKDNAIYNAHTPCFDNCINKYPNTTLRADGQVVGLPKGQMGNSEVGHLNIGAGRIVHQELEKINRSIKDQTFFKNKNLLNAFDYANHKNSKVHIIGLLSDGGVHSHINHLGALCKMADKYLNDTFYIHGFLDGRDCSTTGGVHFINTLEKQLQKSKGRLASVMGRYYAMDRDHRWERTKTAYDCLVKGVGDLTENIEQRVRKNYENNITDEFIKPLIKIKDNHALTKIEANDVVICFNFRTDRCRQIVTALTQQAFPKFGLVPLSIKMVTMTQYDSSFNNVSIVFDSSLLKDTLGEVLEKNNCTQLRIAESEKYPHVTYFFSGGRESVFKKEKRILVPSPKVPTYDLQPQMSAASVTEKMCDVLRKKEFDFICLNFANPDMVGHTGNYKAIVKAVEYVDGCLQKILKIGSEAGYKFIIIADHGNAEQTLLPNGDIHTAHTTNLVPFIVTDTSVKLNIKQGILGDVAPSILKLMGIAQPKLMTGKSIID